MTLNQRDIEAIWMKVSTMRIKKKPKNKIIVDRYWWENYFEGSYR